MNWTPRRIGGAGVLLLVAALIWDVAQHREAVTEIPQKPRSTFRQSVEGLGVLETSFQGALSLVHENRVPLEDGTIKRIPVVGIEGHDPEFADSDMFLPDSKVRCWKADNRELLCEIRSPMGTVPMRTDSPSLALDSSSTWSFKDAVVSFPETSLEENYYLATPHLNVEPELRRFSSDVQFELRSGNLSLEGVGFVFEPSQQRGEWGTSGAVSWSLLDSEGHQWSGILEGPAVMGPGANEQNTLQFRVDGKSTIDFPADFSGLGTLQGEKLDFLLSKTNLGWQPLHASFLAECRFFSSDSSEDSFFEMQAPAAFFNWAEGTLEGLELPGPVSFSNHSVLSWAVADDGLWLETDGSGYAWGGIFGELQSGTFSASTCEFSSSETILRGPVRFANGTGGCDLFVADSAGNISLEGNASVQLEKDLHVQAEKIARDIQIEGKSETVTATGNVFARFQGREKLPVSLRASQLIYSPDWQYTKEPGFQATGSIQIKQDQASFVGRSFRYQNNGRAQLEGWPAAGEIETSNGKFRISAERILLDGDWVYPSGDPKIEIPAGNLGLDGSEVTISSKRMSYNLKSQAWELLGDVRFLGALRGRAQKVSGRPEAFEFFPGALGFCVLSGTLAEGDSFYLNAKTISAFPEGHLRLYGNASAVIEAPGANPLELNGREALFRRNGGWMKHHVSLLTNDISGNADEVSWERKESGNHTLTLLGAAQLSSPEAQVVGQEIQYATEGPHIYVLGSKDELANISFSDGAAATGEWLQLDLTHRLLSGEGGTLIKP